MPVGSIIGAEFPVALVRTEPIQQRGADRLNALLDAAATIVDEIGFDRLTTAMIAERSGASIGTVYRYFPDRIAVLQALRERSMARFRSRIVSLIESEAPSSWWEAVDLGVTSFVELYRAEPGFRIIHFVDRERIPAGGTEDDIDMPFAKMYSQVLTEVFGLDGGENLDFHLEVAVEMMDAILSRAFAYDADGDERYIAEARRVLHGYLTGLFGPVAG
ncbi:TetR/AcrR family transcriptional regulator [Leifsonia sp. Leaf264]|uniref:TetR/AcrR family transcriptional regulator n=1 Tax=Leifsonia sp. Leaf264 TaxID=1736314 RepID=UPI0006FD42BA|nr:TetR/AcrR family transcriptional regulator [Leifsonia sp. Leaf264]KQP01227.1 TetR family transcriptional regulator [Leifsonia sp. Leaf264]